CLDSHVSRQLLCDHIRFAGVAASKTSNATIEVTELVAVPAGAASEIETVLIADDRYHASAHRDPWFALPAGLPPCLTKELDLFGLELIKGHPGVLGQKRGAHEMHALLAGPFRGGARTGTPPDPLVEAGRLRLNRKRARLAGHGWVRLRHSGADDGRAEERSLGPRKVGVALVVWHHITEGLGSAQRGLR